MARYNRANKRKRYVPKKRKRRVNKNFSNAVARPLSNKRMAKFRYCDYFTLNPAVGGLAATHVFSANGLFDVDITGVGHQPAGFDELMSLYKNYTVLGSKIQVTASNSDSTDSGLVGIMVKGDTTTLTDYRQMVENGLTKWKRISKSGGRWDTVSVTRGFSTKKFFTKSSITSEDDLAGSAAANPTEQAYFHVWAAPAAVADMNVVGCNVVIDFIALLTEPVTLSLS